MTGQPAWPNPALIELIERRREARNLEYKEADAQESMRWGSADVNAKIARTVMAMANIGGGAIVLGMRQIGPDVWEPVGVSEEVDASYRQDDVQSWVNERADPYVEFIINHIEYNGMRFVIIEVAGFEDLPVVCAKPGGTNRPILRQGAIYTRPRRKHETTEIQSQTEMRELLDIAIERGVQRRLKTVLDAWAQALSRAVPAPPTDEQLFERQREDL